MPRFRGTCTITATTTIEYDSLDEIEAADDEEARDLMSSLTVESFKEGNYDINSVTFEDVAEVSEENAES